MTQIHQQRTMLCIFDFVFFRDQQANSKSQHNITWTPEVIADLIDARKEARRRKKVWEGMFLKTEFREIDFMEKNPEFCEINFTKIHFFKMEFVCEITY